MGNPTVRIHNSETDEVIDRDMNEAEFAQWRADKVKTEAESNAAKLLINQKAALLNKLGITADEAKLLLS